MTICRCFSYINHSVTGGSATAANAQLGNHAYLPHNRCMTRTEQFSKTEASSESSTMVAFDVLMMGAGVSAQSVVNAVDAFSDLGHVYLLPPVAAVVQDEGETAGVTAHHLRIQIGRAHV